MKKWITQCTKVSDVRETEYRNDITFKGTWRDQRCVLGSGRWVTEMVEVFGTSLLIALVFSRLKQNYPLSEDWEEAIEAVRKKMHELLNRQTEELLKHRGHWVFQISGHRLKLRVANRLSSSDTAKAWNESSGIQLGWRRLFYSLNLINSNGFNKNNSGKWIVSGEMVYDWTWLLKLVEAEKRGDKEN